MITSKPDKRNGCVLKNKFDYLEKIGGDSSNFKPYGQAKELDIINKVKSEIINFLKQLYFKNGFSENAFNSIKPVGSEPHVYIGYKKLIRESSI